MPDLEEKSTAKPPRNLILRWLQEAWQFWCQEGTRAVLFSREAPFLIQFGKYGVCGVCSLVVFMAVALAGEHAFPRYFGEGASDEVRSVALIWLHLAAFLPSNLAAYGLNRWLVFTPGRYGLGKELALFTLISFLSFAVGEILPVVLIRYVGVPNGVAHFSFVISSAMVNFVCRKFLVFAK